MVRRIPEDLIVYGSVSNFRLKLREGDRLRLIAKGAFENIAGHCVTLTSGGAQENCGRRDCLVCTRPPEHMCDPGAMRWVPGMPDV